MDYINLAMRNKLQAIRRKAQRKQEVNSAETTQYHKEKQMLYNARYILKLIKTGDYNPLYKNHRMAAQYAQKLGALDKDLNILKEI